MPGASCWRIDCPTTCPLSSMLAHVCVTVVMSVLPCGSCRPATVEVHDLPQDQRPMAGPACQGRAEAAHPHGARQTRCAPLTLHPHGSHTLATGRSPARQRHVTTGLPAACAGRPSEYPSPHSWMSHVSHAVGSALGVSFKGLPRCRRCCSGCSSCWHWRTSASRKPGQADRQPASTSVPDRAHSACACCRCWASARSAGVIRSGLRTCRCAQTGRNTATRHVVNSITMDAQALICALMPARGELCAGDAAPLPDHLAQPEPLTSETPLPKHTLAEHSPQLLLNLSLSLTPTLI